jgi:hypothetical protein
MPDAVQVTIVTAQTPTSRPARRLTEPGKSTARRPILAAGITLPAAAGAAPVTGVPLLTSLLAWLGALLRRGQVSASRLTAEDVRVLAILTVAVIVTLGGQVDLNAPAPVKSLDAMPAAPVVVDAPSPAPAAGGMVDDPTSRGQITATTAHGLEEIRAKFGPVLRGASCWDKHAWNPKSDHPKGKACDVYTSPAGKFASGDGLAHGNELAAWLRQNAGPLGVAYVIWQGRIWSPQKGDRAYGGGGVYDPTDATGGHFDHIHVSFKE